MADRQEVAVTWTKLGDEFCDVAIELDDAAFRTHVEALGFSNRHLLDLLIPKRALRRFASTATPDASVELLIWRGWWEDRGDAWYIGLRWPDWQRDRLQVETRRKSWSDSKVRTRKHKLGDHGMCLPDKCPYAQKEDGTDDAT